MQLPPEIDLITIYGPTASGKTAIAVHLADLIGGVILSGDSRQVYRGMDIGTGKDLEDYQIEDRKIPYYLIDIAEAGERYNMHRYMEDFDEIMKQIPQSTPKILCGGTGLYMTSVLGGYKVPDVPENLELRAALTELSVEQLQSRLQKSGGVLNDSDRLNSRRLIRAIEVAEYFSNHGETYVHRKPLQGPIFCIDVSREVRRDRISSRLERRLQEGMIDEVRGLLEHVTPDQLRYYGLEYRFVTDYVTGNLSYEDMKSQLEIAIHQFAKRQMTWVRGMERRGFKIQYIKPLDTPRATAESMKEIIYN